MPHAAVPRARGPALPVGTILVVDPRRRLQPADLVLVLVGGDALLGRVGDIGADADLLGVVARVLSAL